MIKDNKHRPTSSLEVTFRVYVLHCGGFRRVHELEFNYNSFRKCALT